MLFKVVQSERLNIYGDSVVIVFRCPEAFGPDFFQRERQYQVELVEKAPETGFAWSSMNTYHELRLPTLWALSCKPRFFSGSPR